MTLGSHQTTIGKSQVHITPKWIIDRLGPFDLDPCAADPRPWDCARRNIALPEDGLKAAWQPDERTWLNPPFNRYEVGGWIRKLGDHRFGMALLHARTEAEWFEPIWERGALILFMADRLKFCRPDGSEQPANSGAPAILVAFGHYDFVRLMNSGIPGAYVNRWDWWPEKTIRQRVSEGSAVPLFSAPS